MTIDQAPRNLVRDAAPPAEWPSGRYGVGPRRSDLGLFVGAFGHALLFQHGRVVLSVDAADWEPVDEADAGGPGVWSTCDDHAWIALGATAHATHQPPVDAAALAAAVEARSREIVEAPRARDTASPDAEAPAMLDRALPVAPSVVERADLDVRVVASALGCSVRTVERRIIEGRFVGDASPVVIGGLERRRYRWRASQLPAIRAIFAPPPVTVSPPAASISAVRSKGRSPGGRKTRKAADEPRKDILARVRDGD